MPVSTLQYVDNEDSYIKSASDVLVKEKKTEKSVHFASDDETISSSQLSVATSSGNSQEIISWMPSENLYSDTFITETHVDSSSAVTYGSSTFIDESEDETKTESDYSSSKSLSTSEAFSSHTATDTYREWKDVTEIIKDIEDLEESEFVPNKLKNGEDTDEFSDSLEHEIAEEMRQEFLVSAIRRITLASQLSPRSESSAVDRQRYSKDNSGEQMNLKSKEQKSFCQKMIQRCKDKAGQDQQQSGNNPASSSTQGSGAGASDKSAQPLEHYGINPALINRLKMDNLLLSMEKKSRDLDKETQNSLQFIESNQHLQEDAARKKFLSMATARAANLNTEDRIHEHLISMHPVKWFADFVNDLPNIDESSREILYRYKKQVEKRMEESGS